MVLSSAIVCDHDRLRSYGNQPLTSSSYDADANRLIRQLDWKNLSTQFQIQKALLVYKSLNGLAPEYFSSKLVKRNETPSGTLLRNDP